MRDAFREAVIRRHFPPREIEINKEETRCENLIVPPENSENAHSRGNSEENSYDSAESDCEKLTRAQRKRIRKRKLKEAASHRRKLIGPLFRDEYSQCIKSDTCVEPDNHHCSPRDGLSISDKRTESPSEEKGSVSSKLHAKVKQRRLAKKIIKNHDNSTQREQQSKAFVGEICGDGFIIKHV